MPSDNTLYALLEEGGSPTNSCLPHSSYAYLNRDMEGFAHKKIKPLMRWRYTIGKCVCTLVENMVKKNRSRLSIAVLLTTLISTCRRFVCMWPYGNEARGLWCLCKLLIDCESNCIVFWK
jgi:hypothetical protein